MKVLIVELEHGIAAASGSASPDPSVNDWNGGEGGTSNSDF
ncbi:hypothetical protein [Sphingobacterium cellulitidis]|nr:MULTISPECIES: hypothetical protein [Sphingobacterium]MBA8987553.1 hypothetical protein [Sphingobacterium soli]